MLLNLNQEGEKFDFFNSTVNPQTLDVDYDEPVKDGPWMILKPGQAFWEKKLASRTKKVEHVLNPKTRQMERNTFYPELSPADEKKEREEFWDYCIVDFGGFKDQNGKVLKVTKETKVAMVKVPVVERFITRCFQIIGTAEVAAKEAEEKN